MVVQHPDPPRNPSTPDVLLSHRFAAVDTLLLDVSVPSAANVAVAAASAGTTILPFCFTTATITSKEEKQQLQQWPGDIAIDELTDADDVAFFATHISGETRALFGTALNLALGQGIPTDVSEKNNANGTTEEEPEEQENEEEEQNRLEIITFRMVTPSHTLSPSAILPSLTSRRRVLHVAGATSSSFYKGVSDMYFLESVRYLSTDSDISTTSSNHQQHPVSSLFTHMVAYIHADDGSWSVSDDALTFDIDTAPRMSTGDAIAAITRLQPDVVQPHMYDYAGMTAFRSLFEDVLCIPVIGANSAAMALSTHKARTLAVARQAGVPVAPSVVVRKVEGCDSAEEEQERYDVCGRTVKVRNAEELVNHLGFELPVMVKPAEEDNSLGITRAATPEQFSKSLHSAFQFGGDVLVEAYIPLGREVRVAVVENANGDMIMLPVMEYLFSGSHSVRTSADKLAFDDQGNPCDFSKATRRRLPADDSMSQTLLDSLRAMATDAHKALGCTDYSIYDVRIDPNERVFMLESCLYCSFSHRSALALMAGAGGIEPRRLFDQMADWAISRRITGRGVTAQKMKKKNSEGKETKTSKGTGVTALVGGVIGMKAR